MNKSMTLISLVLGFSLVLLVGSAFAYPPGYWEHNAIRPYPAGEHAMGMHRAMNWRAVEASGLIGQRVNDRTGNYIGQISNLVVDQANDRVALVVLSNVPGFGTDQVAIPYGCLARSGWHTFTVRFPAVAAGSIGSLEDPDLHFLKQYPADSPLYSIPKPIDPNWVAEIYRTYGRMPYWTQKGARALSTAELYKSTRMIGTRVESPQGEVKARIADFTINSSNGYIPLLVLAEVEGRTAHRFAVPFDAFSITREKPFVINGTEDEIASAPTFHQSDMYSRRYANRVYRSFGLQPPWTQGPKAKAMDPYRWGGEAQNF